MFRWKSLAAAAVATALVLTGCSAGGDPGTSESSKLTPGVLGPATTFEAAAPPDPSPRG